MGLFSVSTTIILDTNRNNRLNKKIIKKIQRKIIKKHRLHEDSRRCAGTWGIGQGDYKDQK